MLSMATSLIWNPRNFFILFNKNELRVTNISTAAQVQKWVKYLTDTMHKHIPGSLVIFYDSITTSGSLQWQSELNYQNKVVDNFISLEKKYSKMFFDVCDMFFTDYH